MTSFRDDTTPAAADQPRRTVADLLDGAARLRADRQRREAARRAEENTRREHARALARERRLDELADDEEAAWARVHAMIATRTPGEYVYRGELPPRSWRPWRCSCAGGVCAFGAAVDEVVSGQR